MHGEGVFKEVLSKHKFWPPCAVTNTRNLDCNRLTSQQQYVNTMFYMWVHAWAVAIRHQ